MRGTRLIPRCRNSSECCPDKSRWEHMKLPTMSVDPPRVIAVN
jgi:hypothetical protein